MTTRFHAHGARRATAFALATLLFCAPLMACGDVDDEGGMENPDATAASGASWISSVDWDSHPAGDTDLTVCGDLDAPISVSDLAAHSGGVNIVTADEGAVTDVNQLATSDEQLDLEDTDSDAIGISTDSCTVTMSISFALYTDETSTVKDAFNGGWWRLSLDSTSSTTIDGVMSVDTADEDSNGVSDVGSVRLNAIIRTYGAPTYIWYYASQFDPDNAAEGGAYSLVWERGTYAFDIVVQDVVAGSSTVADAAGFGYYPSNAWSREKEMLQDAGIEDAQGNALTFSSFSEVAKKL